MIKNIHIILFIGLVWSEPVDELETLYNNKGRFIFAGETIYKNEGVWYSDDTNEPFTGTVGVYLKKLKEYKVAECTIVDGLKNGIFIQHFNNKEMITGITGLYVNDKKEGAWTWIKSKKNYNTSTGEGLDLQTITSIDFRDGIKHGSETVHKSNLGRYGYIQNYIYPRYDIISQGQYFNGDKTGDWYYYDNNQDSTSSLFYWSKKQIYYKNKLMDSECREPWGKKVNCDSYEEDDQEKVQSISLTEIPINNFTDLVVDNIIVIKDNLGVDVEIDIEEFSKHIDQFHGSVISIHKEGEHYFTVNDSFRKMIDKKLQLSN